MTEPTLKDRIEDIYNSGMSYKDIAKACGCDESTIYRIKEGQIKDPRHSVGKAIEALHKKVTATIKKKAA